jgi:peptidyl-dipeptidase Dcp
MKHPLALALGLALAATAPAFAQHSHSHGAAVTDSKPSSNPFFADSPLPLHYPQFDRI